MTDEVDALQQAMLGQAERLAEQYRDQARASRAEILTEMRDRLRLREEREILLAKSLAERSYRRQVLSRELAMQAKLDRLRWDLVSGVKERLRDHLTSLTDDQAGYLELLYQLIASAAQQFAGPALVIEANARDRSLLAAHWDGALRAAGDKQLSLSELPIDCLGGVVLRTPDNRQRLDQTFEGRMHRLADELHRAIQDKLVPATPETLSHGMLT